MAGWRFATPCLTNHELLDTRVPDSNHAMHPEQEPAPMAQPTTLNEAPVTEDAFLADRQSFWSSFTSFTFAAVLLIAVLLIGLWWFLV